MPHEVLTLGPESCTFEVISVVKPISHARFMKIFQTLFRNKISFLPSFADMTHVCIVQGRDVWHDFEMSEDVDDDGSDYPIMTRSTPSSCRLEAPDLSAMVDFVERSRSSGASFAFLPHVAEYDDEQIGHMSLFVVDFATSRLYHVDPNGRWSNPVNDVILAYFRRVSSLLDLHFVESPYVVNRKVDGLDDGHCVITSILTGIVIGNIGVVESAARIIEDESDREIGRIIKSLYKYVFDRMFV